MMVLNNLSSIFKTKNEHFSEAFEHGNVQIILKAIPILGTYTAYFTL